MLFGLNVVKEQQDGMEHVVTSLQTEQHVVIQTQM